MTKTTIVKKSFQGLLLILAAAPCLLRAAKDEPIHYEKLDLTIQLSRLRAGNHDASGENSYYFQTTVYGLPILKDEIKKRFEERLKIERVLPEFAAIKIKNLSYWQPGKKPNPADSISVSGDLVREIVAETMRTYQVPEDQVAILLKTVMYERNKKFMFFGDDLKIGASEYFLIPETLPHNPIVKDTDMSIKDALGTAVDLSLRFKDITTPTAQ